MFAPGESLHFALMGAIAGMSESSATRPQIRGGGIRATGRRYEDGKDSFDIKTAKCPGCMRVSVTLDYSDDRAELIWPRYVNRGFKVEFVDWELVADYREAVAVSGVSPNASAALARRCLQMMLVKQGAPHNKKLHEQIDAMEDRLPTDALDYVHGLRNLGNLAAHASRDSSTLEIVNVSDEEVQYMLGLIESLFEHFYIRPAIQRSRLGAINDKVKGAKKLRGSDGETNGSQTP